MASSSSPIDDEEEEVLTAVFNSGSDISVPMTYNDAAVIAEKYLPSPQPTSATNDPGGNAFRNCVAPGHSTPRFPRV
jgi:hypothetical protein